jgi:hypothetical protein
MCGVPQDQIRTIVGESFDNRVNGWGGGVKIWAELRHPFRFIFGQVKS